MYILFFNLISINRDIFRGKDIEHRIIHTETDSVEHEAPILLPRQPKSPIHMRIEEDILVGYATLLGKSFYLYYNRLLGYGHKCFFKRTLSKI